MSGEMMDNYLSTQFDFSSVDGFREKEFYEWTTDAWAMTILLLC